MKNLTETFFRIFHVEIATKSVAISTKHDYELLIVILTIIGLILAAIKHDNGQKK